jgi:hypothetical protein
MYNAPAPAVAYVQTSRASTGMQAFCVVIVQVFVSGLQVFVVALQTLFEAMLQALYLGLQKFVLPPQRLTGI